MAALVITYSFTPNTTIASGQLNTNFQDVVDALSDGSTDFTIGSLVVNGAVTLNGSTTIGNASADDFIVSASLASSIPIKTNNLYDIGGAAKGLASIYFASGASNSLRVLFSGGASNLTWTLPGTNGAAGKGLTNDGSGTWAYAPLQTASVVKTDTDYTILDTDGYLTIIASMTDGNNRVITLPTLADNLDRTIIVKRKGVGTGTLTVDGEGAETLDTVASVILYAAGDEIRLQASAARWEILATYWGGWKTETITGTFTNTTYTGKSRRMNDTVDFEIYASLIGTAGAATFTITLPNSWTADTAKMANASNSSRHLGMAFVVRGSRFLGTVRYVTSSTFGVCVFDDAAAGVLSGDVSNSVPDTFVSGDEITMKFSIPITQCTL